MQKKYVDLEMSAVNTVNNEAIVSQNSSISRQNSSISRSDSIKKMVSQKKETCDEACQQYGWVAGAILFTTGLIIGTGYLIRFLTTE